MGGPPGRALHMEGLTSACGGDLWLGLSQPGGWDTCLHEFFRKKPILCALPGQLGLPLSCGTCMGCPSVVPHCTERQLVLFLWLSLLWLLLITTLPSSEVKGGLWCVPSEGPEQKVTLGPRTEYCRSCPVGGCSAHRETAQIVDQGSCRPAFMGAWGLA